MSCDQFLDGVYVHVADGGLDYGYCGSEMVFSRVEFYCFYKDGRIDHRRITKTGKYDYTGTYTILGAHIRLDWFGRLHATTESLTYSPDKSRLIIGGRLFTKSQAEDFPTVPKQDFIFDELMPTDKRVLGDYVISMDLQNLFVKANSNTGKARLEETYRWFDFPSKTWIQLQDKGKKTLPISVFKEGMTFKVRIEQ